MNLFKAKKMWDVTKNNNFLSLFKSKLLSVPSMMCTVAATYGYQSTQLQNDVSTIKQLLLENYRTHFAKIASFFAKT